MIQFGLATHKRNYFDEIDLAKSLGFDFFQIWLYNGSLSVDTLPEPKGKSILDASFPIIIHAVFDIPDFKIYDKIFFNTIEYFGHKEVIIHPICKKEQITNNTVYLLKENIEKISKKLSERGVKLFLENNSVIDGFFNTVDDLRIIFEPNPDIGLLLDLAHINNYDHLEEIVKMRYPECIHIADKHFSTAHEHITLGEGDLDFKMIFSKIIPGYNGKIILEAADSIDGIKKSKEIMNKIFGIESTSRP
jgi:sugar phosphate isomerase/epimerase